MKQTKYSRQREMILHAVQSACNHPTADWVYQQVRKSCPTISLATVYRNLNQLAEAGIILKITSAAGGDRFDRTTCGHYHLYCTACGGVFDLPVPYMDHLNALAAQKTGFAILSHDIQFVGLCDTCNQIKKGEMNHGIERIQDRAEFDDGICG